MKAPITGGLAGLHIAAASTVFLLAGCWERPPIDAVQGGYRGTAMVAMNNPRTVDQQKAANVAPEPVPAVPAGGPAAATVYKNVPVLGGLGIGEFTRTMVAMTNWVAPNEGCTYCHKAGEDFSSDALYTKVVARRMLQMTQALNSEWKPHVGTTGVTCYTCHRGNNIPQNVWFSAPPGKYAAHMLGNDAGQNKPSTSVGLTSLPYDPFSLYLTGTKEIRVASTTALPTAAKQSIKQTESTYALMVHMSEGLGVNCTHCHNTQSFSSWEGSTPKRVTAWHGIRMARELNDKYMLPLTETFPTGRKGSLGDVAKVNCTTCHQGVNKPLLGAQMAKDYAALLAPIPAVAPDPMPAVASAASVKK